MPIHIPYPAHQPTALPETLAPRHSGHMLKYLARYSHRVAISNPRLVSMEDENVTFKWKDYKRGHRLRTMTLEAVEFIRRFLLLCG